MPNFDNYPGTPPVAAYTHGTVTVGTTAVPLFTTVNENNGGVLVQNNSTSSQIVYLGGSTVTATGATEGYGLAAAASVTVPTQGGAQCELYAIASAAGASVTFLYPTN
jgi:hypothetical protein